jgi:hypothetical protein
MRSEIRSILPKAVFPLNTGQECTPLTYVCDDLVLTPHSDSSTGGYSATYDNRFDHNTSFPAIPSSDVPHMPTTTHGVSSSSGYGLPHAVSEGPPISTSTGEAPANPRYEPNRNTMFCADCGAAQHSVYTKQGRARQNGAL